MQRLIIEGYGKRIGIKGKRIVVKDQGKIIHQATPDQIGQIIVTARGSVSFQALRLLSHKGVNIVILDRIGRITTRLTPPKSGNIFTRRAQFDAYHDQRGVELAKALITSKIRNQIATLGTLAKRRKGSLSQEINNKRKTIEQRLEEIEDIHGPNIESIRGTLMGFEGDAASTYWSALTSIIPPKFNFNTRSGRPAPDPVNSMLNYGYGVLMNEVWTAVEISNLDPYAGFLHADRPARPSLVLDIMEEFRQQIVDKTVIKLISKKLVDPTDFERKGDICLLKDESRHALLSNILGKLEKPTTYTASKTWRDIIHEETNKTATFLEKQTKSYKGFYLRW